MNTFEISRIKFKDEFERYRREWGRKKKKEKWKSKENIEAIKVTFLADRFKNIYYVRKFLIKLKKRLKVNILI